MRQEPTGERQKLRLKEKNKEKPKRQDQSSLEQRPRRDREGCAAGMTLMMLWSGQAKGVLGSWGIICLVISLLLQQPGVHSKCYFQAQGKAGGGIWKGRGQRELG